MRTVTVAELFPFPCIYRGVTGADAPKLGAALATFAKECLDHKALVSAVRAEVQREQERDALHPMRYAAGVLFEDGEVHTQRQRRAVEYGNTLDSVSALLPFMESKAPVRPVVAMMMDHFGLLHSPFSPARSQLVERGFGDLQFVVHDYPSYREGRANALEPILVQVEQLFPDPPDMRALFQSPRSSTP